MYVHIMERNINVKLLVNILQPHLNEDEYNAKTTNINSRCRHKYLFSGMKF